MPSTRTQYLYFDGIMPIERQWSVVQSEYGSQTPVLQSYKMSMLEEIQCINPDGKHDKNLTAQCLGHALQPGRALEVPAAVQKSLHVHRILEMRSL